MKGLQTTGWMWLLAACNPSSEVDHSPSDSVSTVPVETPTTDDDDSIDALRALGYLDYAPREDMGADGLRSHDSERSYPGLTLLVSRVSRSADLISLTGQVVHHWNSPDSAGRWARARLLPDGDLLVVGKQPDGPTEGRYIQRLNAAGQEVWRRSIAAHHDVTPGPRGQWLSLALEYRDLPEVDETVPVRDDRIVFLDDQGSELNSISLYDSLMGAGVPLNGVQPSSGDSGMMVDLFHSNSVLWMDSMALEKGHDFDFPLYRPGGILVCIRHQNLVVILDRDGNVRWSWGRGELSGPHDATLLKTGNVLIFDKGLGRNRSRIVEVDPRTNEIVWQYQSQPPSAFYTASRGSAQRLPNGNTLIAESDSGHAFEVTAGGEIVWDYWTPHRAPSGERATIIRAIRYPETWWPDVGTNLQQSIDERGP